eukprot:PhF_6_TR621/c0_g1_i1/m.813
METWLKTQTTCGPHDIDDEKRQLNRDMQKRVAHLLPVDDPFKVNDVDLLYRFLIARKWNLDAAIEMFTNYVSWRKDNNVNTIVQESFPADILENYPGGFMGVDVHGNPLYFEKPDPKGITYLLGKYERSVLLRWHILMMELGRRRAKILGKDRVTVVMDLSLVSVGIIANTTATGFLKEIAHTDQAVYPECMRYMILLNPPWTFSTLWAVVRPLLDERVQKKINMVKGNIQENIAKFVSPDQVPDVLGGTGGEWRLMNHEIESALESHSLMEARQQSYRDISSSAFEGVPHQESIDQDDDDFQSVCSNETDLDRLRTDSGKCGAVGASEWAEAEQSAVRMRRTSTSATGASHGSPSPRAVAPSFRSTPTSLQIQLQNIRNAQGYPSIRGIHNGEPIGESSLSLIVLPTPKGTKMLAELVTEPGHPVHVYILVVDENHSVRFILKRRRIHKEIEIAEPTNQLNTLLTDKLKYKGKSATTMVCRPIQGRPDSDWVIKKSEGPSPRKVLLRFEKETAEWDPAVSSSLSTTPPHMIFALVVGLHQLWLI